MTHITPLLIGLSIAVILWGTVMMLGTIVRLRNEDPDTDGSRVSRDRTGPPRSIHDYRRRSARRDYQRPASFAASPVARHPLLPGAAKNTHR